MPYSRARAAFAEPSSARRCSSPTWSGKHPGPEHRTSARWHRRRQDIRCVRWGFGLRCMVVVDLRNCSVGPSDESELHDGSISARAACGRSTGRTVRTMTEGNLMADVMKTIDAGGVTLGVEHFGDAAAPLVLLVGGTTMLSWPSALCAALARGGRHVVRYDLRDSGSRPPSILSLLPTRCAIWHQTPRRSPTNLTPGRRT